MRSNGSHDHTGPATRATAERITRLLDSESHRADVLHEEIPDWVDIVRRPTPRPTPPPPKEKKAVTTPEKRRGKPHSKTDLEEAARAEVQAGLDRAGRKPCSVSVELFGHTGMSNWLRTGKGLGPENVAKALEWARNVIAPEDEPHRVFSRNRRQVISHFANGEAVYAWEDCEEPAFDPQPYHETGLLDLEPKEPLAPEDWPRIDRSKFEPEPDPAAFVLETWAAAKLTYAMETLGLVMPEGYRFRVTVEKSNG